MINITPIVEAVVGLAVAVITVFVIPYFKSKTNAQQQVQILAWVKIAVSAAEQIFTGDGKGTEKKQYVLDWLHSHNITVDESRLDALIESAVYALKNGEV